MLGLDGGLQALHRGRRELTGVVRLADHAGGGTHAVVSPRVRLEPLLEVVMIATLISPEAMTQTATRRMPTEAGEMSP